MGSLEVIGEEIVGVSLGWVKAGIGGHFLVMVGVEGHFVEVALVVECEEEEGEVEGD